MDVNTGKTNILLFAGTLRAGGTEKHYYQLICNLGRNKFNIHLGFKGDDYCNFGPLPDDVKQVIFPTNYFKTAKLLKNYCKQFQISLVYTVAFETSLPVLISKFIGNKIVYITAKRGVFDFNWKRKFLSFWIDVFSSKIITNSNRILDSLPLWKRRKAKLIYNGIDGTFLSNRDESELLLELGVDIKGQFIIGTVGRLSLDKGQDVLINAFRIVIEKYKNLILILIGNGEMEEEWKMLAEKTGLDKQIIFAGNKKNGGDFIRTFDLFVLPSRTESFPNALLEAMHVGCPSIASDVGGVPEIITEGLNGLLVPIENVKKLAQKIIWAIENKAELCKIGEDGKCFVRKKYGLKDYISAHENIFDKY